MDHDCPYQSTAQDGDDRMLYTYKAKALQRLVGNMLCQDHRKVQRTACLILVCPGSCLKQGAMKAFSHRIFIWLTGGLYLEACCDRSFQDHADGQRATRISSHQCRQMKPGFRHFKASFSQSLLGRLANPLTIARPIQTLFFLFDWKLENGKAALRSIYDCIMAEAGCSAREVG